MTTHPVDHGGYVIDSTVAARDIKDGEVILRVPEHLVVTLNRWEWRLMCPVWLMRFRGVMRTSCEAALTSRSCMPWSRADQTQT